MYNLNTTLTLRASSDWCDSSPTAGVAYGVMLHIARRTHDSAALGAALQIADAYAQFRAADAYVAHMQFLCEDGMVQEAGDVFGAVVKDEAKREVGSRVC